MDDISKLCMKVDCTYFDLENGEISKFIIIRKEISKIQIRKYLFFSFLYIQAKLW